MTDGAPVSPIEEPRYVPSYRTALLMAQTSFVVRDEKTVKYR